MKTTTAAYTEKLTVPWGLWVLTALVLVAAGCGGSGGGDEVASCDSSLGNDKFCLVEDPVGGGGGLRRVRALRDITVLENGQTVLVAQRGDLGGWVEGEENLSAGGSAWVAGDAKVFDDARVEGDALVTGRTKVFGGARVSNWAQVKDHAVVCSGAEVYEQAQVGGEAVVCGWVPRAFSLSAWAGAEEGAKVARMGAWVQGWGEVGMEPVLRRAGLGAAAAQVFGESVISDGAWVFEQAKAFGKAEISDQARVYENAQVFDNSRISGQASVYGRALVFSSADSEFVSGSSSGGSNTLHSVFVQEDVARVFWTNTICPPNVWNISSNLLEESLGDGPLASTVEPKPSMLKDAGTESQCNTGTVPPTKVLGDARVYGNSRVWGGVTLSGNARILEDSRVSGGSTKFNGQICQDYWTNGISRDGTDMAC
ncbi:hypothetical protein [Candidatus Poriferisocius sp.]|uniref:hypothetical protein n=1 Tax=Candidatus Poriferisocius sp. TaxID=3101276 RepID=UPI003B5A423C